MVVYFEYNLNVVARLAYFNLAYIIHDRFHLNTLILLYIREKGAAPFLRDAA